MPYIVRYYATDITKIVEEYATKDQAIDRAYVLANEFNDDGKTNYYVQVDYQGSIIKVLQK
jgi:hypothetical protein